MEEAACEQRLKSGVAWHRREGFSLTLTEEKRGLARRLGGWQQRGTRSGIYGVHRKFRDHLAIHFKQKLFSCYRGGNQGLEKYRHLPKGSESDSGRVGSSPAP